MNNIAENIIDNKKFQVFIMCCPAYFPFNFFRHPWIVLNKKGEISRWEIKHFINKENNTHLFVNNQPPFEGINKTTLIKAKWSSKVLKVLEGEIALKVIALVEKTKEEYQYLDRYCFNGPNSNTYLSWVLRSFPEIDLKLSWRFIGKNYKFDLK